MDPQRGAGTAEPRVEEAERALASELAKVGLEALPAAAFDGQQLPSVVRTQLLWENAQRKLKRLEELRKTNQAFVTADGEPCARANGTFRVVRKAAA